MARLDALTDWERRPLRGMRVGLGPTQDLTALLGKPQKALRACAPDTPLILLGLIGSGSAHAL